MANEMTPGFFQQFGVDTRDQETILAEQSQAAWQQQMEQLNASKERFAGDRDIRRAGLAVGNMVAKKLGGPPKDPQQAMVHSAMATAEMDIKDRIKAGELRGEDGSIDVTQVTLAKRKATAENLAQLGHPQAGAMLEEIAASEDAAEKAKIERRKLITSERTAETNADIQDINLREKRRGIMKTVWLQGEVDPNQSTSAFIDPVSGDAILGESGERIPMGEWTDRAPVDPARAKSGRVLTAGDYGVSDKEAGAIRNQIGGIQKQARGAVRLKRALASSIGSDGSVNIMDGAGKATTAVVTALDFLTAVGRQVTTAAKESGLDVSFGITDGAFAGKDLSNRKAALSYARNNDEAITAELGDTLPPSLRNSATARAEYYATLSQLVYARALTNEPGARQLSDADFKNAMAGMAGNTSDPETFRRVILGNVEADIEAFNDRMTALPRPVREGGMIVSADGMARYDEQMAEFQKEFGVETFGSALNPVLDTRTDDVVEGEETYEQRKQRLLGE